MTVDDLGVDWPVTTDSEGQSLPGGTETLVASAVGLASNCDVWFKAPSSWSAVVLRLYGRMGGARSLLRQVTIGRIPRLVDAGELTGIAISIRGRPCTAYELTGQTPSDAVSGGAFYLTTWHGASGLASTGGGAAAPEAPDSPSLVAATLLGTQAGTGTIVPVATDSSGKLIMANSILTPSTVTVTGIAGIQQTVQTGPDEVGGFIFNPSAFYPGDPGVTRTITLSAVLNVSEADQSCILELFNISDGLSVTRLTSTSMVPASVQSAPLVVPTDLPNSRKVYGLRLTRTGGTTANYVVCKYAALEVTYT